MSGSTRLLNQIDRIRAKGVGEHISLPQLVVCGDQSAGKSSVLEGITGVPFPRQDGVCTRFATEIILRHCPDKHEIIAKLLPNASRSEDDRLRMTSFERQLKGFEDLPRVIEEASVLMGVRNSSNPDMNLPAFTADVLRLEVIGNTGLHLTVVDLPGLISVSENLEDMQTVEHLVDTYLESSRTIILAVVPASNDIDTQGIIQRARRFDKSGIRTVGIITKPDLINMGTEARIANLAKNLDRVKLKLGFFLLKNLSPLDIGKGLSWEERQRPWKEQNLDYTRVGIDKLRNFLQVLLDCHIERELPKVRKEVQTLLRDTERQLSQIGPERSTIDQIRLFLTHISMEFYNLAKAAKDGSYCGRDLTFFGAKNMGKNNRLRASIHLENEEFAAHMRTHAAKRRLVDYNRTGSVSNQSETSDESDISDADASNEQILVTYEQMLKWVEEIYLSNRGRELPGTYNQEVLSELFHEQCSRWGNIARDHLSKVSSIVNSFVAAVLDHIIVDDEIRCNVKARIHKSLDSNLEKARNALQDILQDEATHPITYNHYYTDNIQNARADAAKKHMQASMDHAITTEWNGKLHVATKTFVDNVCRQVVERHLMSGLAAVFDPVFVATLSDDELFGIASESDHVRAHRNNLQAKKKAFEESVRELEI
ncbi:hypothetical protein ACEQ8H_002003 [Pleosporales sp. CAS-2024a]